MTGNTKATNPPKDMITPHLIKEHERSERSVASIPWDERLAFHKSLHLHPGDAHDHDHRHDIL